MQKNDIFCKVVNGQLESARVWEDKNFLAILDIRPNTKGMTLVLTKKHYGSYLFDMPDENFTDYLLAAKKVAKVLEKGLGVKRVALVIEGMEIDHAHIKLYPLHGTFTGRTKEKIRNFVKYPGFVTTEHGKVADLGKLKLLAKKIRSKAR